MVLEHAILPPNKAYAISDMPISFKYGLECQLYSIIQHSFCLEINKTSCLKGNKQSEWKVLDLIRM